MMAANVLDKSQLPDFDEETGLLHKVRFVIHDMLKMFNDGGIVCYCYFHLLVIILVS